MSEPIELRGTSGTVDARRSSESRSGELASPGERRVETTAIDLTSGRVAVTGEAADLLRRLTGKHGPLMFHQSGGCCDGSSPMCYPQGEFLTGDADIHLGDLDVGLERAVPVWMSRTQFAYWSHTHLTIDVVPGRGAGFSVEAPEGVRFLIRSRLFTDQEAAALDYR